MPPPTKTPAVPTSVTLKVHARTRAFRDLKDAEVHITAGPAVLTKKTDVSGFVSFTVAVADLAASSPPGTISIRVKKHHYGPDSGPASAITAGEFTLTATVTTSGFDPGTPGLVTKPAPVGTFLDVVLVDGGFRFAAIHSNATRRLTGEEVQQELMFAHHSGLITLTAASDIIVEHDPSMGEFDPCDPAKCKIKSPKADRRVSLQGSKIGQVTFFVLQDPFGLSVTEKSDLIAGQRFTRDTFSWGTMSSLQHLDQRHVVGLARLCSQLNTYHGIVAIYSQGVGGDTSRGDSHGWGLALDLGGVSKELPDPKVKRGMPVRLGVDFIVLLHWGNLPMWDSFTVAAAPTTPASWSRLRGRNDDFFDYRMDPTGAKRRLHYRLDPAPFQDPVPPTTTPLMTEILKVAGHFRDARVIFQAMYDFAVAEYSDNNSDLGRLPPGTVDTPTPIASHHGHKIFFPDYPHPNTDPSNGRQAHNNHIHMELGPTHYYQADGVTPMPRSS